MFSKPQSTSETVNMLWKSLLVVTLFTGVTLVPEAAMATTTNICKVLSNLVSWLTGPIGKSVATLGIIIVGVGALMGKVSWGMAIIVALGVAVIFGAPGIVSAMSQGGKGGFGNDSCI